MDFTRLVDQKGYVRNEVFSEGLHERELDTVFRKCWLLVGHDSLIPNVHDYFTSFMAEDSVIAQRDASGKIRVYLNRCRHRGTRLCLYDVGNAATFTCSYHGWAYSDGALMGVPAKREAYLGDIDVSKFGLTEPPKVANYGGLIFACWDPEVVSIETYLGDARWYLDNFLLRDDGLELVPGPQRYTMPVNWKLLAENFAGDGYHFISTHGSVGRVLSSSQDTRVRHFAEASETYSVAANYGTGAPHGFVEVRIGDASYEADLEHAEGLGPDCVEWVRERHRRLQERLRDYDRKPYAFHAANIFPNFAMIGVGTASYAKGLILHHPRGPSATEVWMWAAVEKSAPAAMKARQTFVLMQRQAAAGMVAPDDHENFERITANLGPSIARRHAFQYGMGLGHENEDPRPQQFRGGNPWPGHLLPKYSEAAQRDFYRYWGALMGAGS
jgi:phenylpropionate dioxygenase-like ring-hydroxylating dioxygenase large terminal subunit